jgi:hypothetical protein
MRPLEPIDHLFSDQNLMDHLDEWMTN